MPRPASRRGLVALLACAALVAGVVPGSATPVVAPVPPLPLVVPVTTANVTHLGTIPLDSPGVGGEVVERPDLGGRYFYVTGAYGLSIYDVADPAAPTRVGYLPFPHSQNEDLKVSDDGTRAVIAADGSLPFSPNRVTTGVHVIDTTDVTDPRLVGSTSPLVRGEGAGLGTSEHTVACADAACDVIYGSSSGSIYVVSEDGTIEVVGRWDERADGTRLGSRHALNRDASGLLVSDSTPRLVIDPIGVLADGATPTAPVVLAEGPPASADPRLQHNNVRVGADEWAPRDPEQEIETVTVEASPRSRSVTAERPRLRAGELLIGQSESNVNPTCANGGGLSTWSMANFDQGAALQQLEVFQPLSGTWADGSPAANVAGCSGHWFTERNGIVAGAWYEHGLRLFDVDREVGTIAEIGFAQPIAGIASAAYWVDDEHVYVVDNLRGIDLYRFDRDAAPAAQAELDASWLSALSRVDPLAEELRLSCRLAAS